MKFEKMTEKQQDRLTKLISGECETFKELDLKGKRELIEDYKVLLSKGWNYKSILLRGELIELLQESPFFKIEEGEFNQHEDIISEPFVWFGETYNEDITICLDSEEPTFHINCESAENEERLLIDSRYLEEIESQEEKKMLSQEFHAPEDNMATLEVWEKLDNIHKKLYDIYNPKVSKKKEKKKSLNQ